MSLPDAGPAPPRQPVFNLPGVIILLLALLAGIHAARMLLLDTAQDNWVIYNFAFFPDRPTFFPVQLLQGADIWSYLTYGLLHADWAHLLINGFWMAAFGSPLAWRFGPLRFLVFSAIAVIAGALLHQLTHGGEQIPLAGASAAISAHMAGAARFLFISLPGSQRSFRSPAAPLRVVFSDARTLTFLGVWFAINLAIGIFGSVSNGAGSIAWEAHIGGFVVGLLLFPLFDPVPRRRADGGGWPA